MTSLHVICICLPSPIKNPGYAYVRKQADYANMLKLHCSEDSALLHTWCYMNIKTLLLLMITLQMFQTERIKLSFLRKNIKFFLFLLKIDLLTKNDNLFTSFLLPSRNASNMKNAKLTSGKLTKL